VQVIDFVEANYGLQKKPQHLVEIAGVFAFEMVAGARNHLNLRFLDAVA
jgi:hypothetical protein